MRRIGFWLVTVLLPVVPLTPLHAVVLWSDLGATLAHETGPGVDILGGAVHRDDTAADTLYFKFHVDPLSDKGTEEYFAAFQLFEGDAEHLGVGNSLKAWAYSAFNTMAVGEFNKVPGDIDLRSAQPESPSAEAYMPYELPRRGTERTIVFRVRFVPGGEDDVTVWLSPDLGPGATEAGQPEALTTSFKANASFNQIRLRHGGGGGGWTFSDMAIATAFSDFVYAASPDLGGVSPTNEPTRLTFRTWQREQGLPQNAVRALIQTHDGYLWIGTDDGLARFDGVRFVSFGLREGLRSGRVRLLLEDSAGSLWIGTTADGLIRWQDGRFRTLTVKDGLPADSITALAEDNNGRLWIGTEAGLVVWDEGRLNEPEIASSFRGHAIATLSRDRRGIIWAGVSGVGVFRLVDGRFKALADPAAEPLLQEPHCVLVDRAERIWVGAGDDFVLCLDGDQWRRYRIPRHLAGPVVNTLAEEPDGTVWAGSASEGLFQFKGGMLTPLSAGSGLPDNFIEALCVDREGNLWIGTAGGLTRFKRSRLLAFSQAEGLGYGAVQGLAEVAPGVLWAAKPGDGIYRWDGRMFSRLSTSGLVRRYSDINTLLTARDGGAWVGAAQGLLRFADAATGDGETEIATLERANVTALAEDRGSNVWAGTHDGALWRLQGGTWLLHTNWSQPRPITAIVPEPAGTVWVATDGGGLFRLQGPQITQFTSKNSGLLSDVLRTLYLDPQGTLWIGTIGGGLSRCRGGRIASFTTREGLPDNTVSQILEDNAQRLWLGNNRGLACVPKAAFDGSPAGQGAEIYPQIFGRAEGMLSEECTGGFYPAGLKTRSGLLCFSTLKGIVVVDPATQRRDPTPPSVVLEEVLVDGVAAELNPNQSPPIRIGAAAARNGDGAAGFPREPAAESAGGEPSFPSILLNPGRHRVEFRYTGISLSAPERVRFRYRLEGLEPEPFEAGSRRVALFSYIPPGQYTFHVSACNEAGVWNEAGARLAVTVLPHFYQAWWFIGLTTVVLLASVAGSARVVEKRRLHRRLQHLEQERALERERTRIAQDLHDDLGSALTRLSLLSDLVRADKHQPAQVESHAQKLSQSAGQTVRALEEIVWALRPGSDSLQSLVEYIAHFANELFEGDRARCRLDLPHDLPARALPPEMRHNIFLIVKEALTNALKHAQAREVKVLAKANASALEIVVQDDGKGFSPAQPPPTGKGHGLGNLRRRAAAMNASLDIQSVPGAGTTVKLRVPFPA
jgi:signal transduction histidine kinase/ligand-binding sensor domain-containing protein